jgi:hypothetical protein
MRSIPHVIEHAAYPALAAGSASFNVCFLDFVRPLSAVLTFRFGS